MANSFGKPPTTQEAVLQELRQQVTDGRLRHGTQIIQETLAAELGVSRVPLREALKTLEADGLVVYRPHRGYFVTDLTREDLNEVHRLRQMLEDEALNVALPNLTGRDVKWLRDQLAALRTVFEGDDIAAMIEANRQFWFGLMGASGMPRLMHLIKTLWDATASHQYGYFGNSRNRELTVRTCENVMRAVEDRDTAAVIRVREELRQHSTRSLVAMFLDEDGESGPRTRCRG